MRPYEGLLTAMVTPFRSDGSVDEEGAVAIGRHLLANGSHGLVVAGTTGEAATMDDEEHLGLIELIVRELATRARSSAVPVPTTRGTPSTSPRRPSRPGWTLSSPSRRTTTSRTGAGSPRTSTRSRAPPATRRSCSTTSPGARPPTCRPTCWPSSAQIDGIEAVKQANSDELQLIDGLAILAGNDDIYGRCLDIGGAGGICVASHVVGPEMRRMYDEPEARAEIDASLQEIYAAMFVTASPAPVKAALEMLGHDTGPLRLPLVECDEPSARTCTTRSRGTGC